MGAISQVGRISGIGVGALRSVASAAGPVRRIDAYTNVEKGLAGVVGGGSTQRRGYTIVEMSLYSELKCFGEASVKRGGLVMTLAGLMK